MSARERLRSFLEQRREMGETEFVLDSLHVDDVLRVLGAGGAAEIARHAPSAGRIAPEGPRSSATPGPAPRPPAGTGAGPRDTGVEHANWREALRAIDSGPSGERPGGGPPPRSQDAGGAAAEHHPSVPNRSKTSGSPVSDNPDHPLDLASLGQGLSVGGLADEGSHASAWNSLDDIAGAVASCTRCGLYAGAKNPVPGHGNPNADFVCVGEAPGANEDEQGLPFVGQAGQLLTKILAAINLTRDDVFICNVLKHRPPGNRNPNPDEVLACSPYLVRQIELLRPKVILALGTFAAQTLLQTREPIGKLRGRLHRYHGVPVIVTYHPAALLRNPSWKRPTWEDVQLARKLFDRVVEP